MAVYILYYVYYNGCLYCIYNATLSTNLSIKCIPFSPSNILMSLRNTCTLNNVDLFHSTFKDLSICIYKIYLNSLIYIFQIPL